MRLTYQIELATRWPLPDQAVLATIDRARCIEWYETVVGLRHQAQPDRLFQDGRLFGVTLVSDFQHMTLVPRRHSVEIASTSIAAIPLCLIVTSPGEALMRQIEQQASSFGGLRVDPATEYSCGIVSDPDGNVWRIVSPSAMASGNSFGASIWWHSANEFRTQNVVLSHNGPQSRVRLRSFPGQNIGLDQTERGARCSLDREMAIEPSLASRLLESLHTMRTTAVKSTEPSTIADGLSISGWQWRGAAEPTHFSWFNPLGQIAEKFCDEMRSVIDDIERSGSGSRLIGKKGLFARLRKWADGTVP